MEGSHCCPPIAVLTGTVKTLSRDPQGGGAAVVTVLSAYKMGGAVGPPPPKGTALRMELLCGQCPALKKGGDPPDPPPSPHPPPTPPSLTHALPAAAL